MHPKNTKLNKAGIICGSYGGHTFASFRHWPIGGASIQDF